MGVLGLLPFLRKVTPRAFRLVPDGGFSFLCGKIVAVDVLNRASKLMYFAGTDDPSQIRQAFAEEISWFLDCGAHPIFVMDGPRPKEKKETTAQRATQKQAYARRAEQAETQEERQALYRRSLKPRSIHIEVIRNVVLASGAEWVVARGEAERKCAMMERAGAVDVVASDDTDLLAMGTRTMLFRPRSKHAAVIECPIILQDLSWPLSRFHEFCIMCGTDFTQRIRGIGPAKARALLDKYKTLDSVLESLRPKRDISRFEEQLEHSRKLLSYKPIAEDFAEWNPHPMGRSRSPTSMSPTGLLPTLELEEDTKTKTNETPAKQDANERNEKPQN
jgi:5'-3' exonuclease